MSPRRSSRARATNQPLGSTTNNSSSSSLSSGRERSTRSQRQQVASPQHSNPRSQSLDDPDDVKPPPRRTRSGHDEVKEPEEPEADEEEEEVTRCVCGQLEYPGLPTPIQDEEKQRAKQGGAATPDELADDGSGIFIQCDICKVWQHGGCVGILDDDSAPEEYFCEQCHKDLHQLSTTATGQKFSRYKPVREEPSPTQSPPPPNTRESSRKAAKENRPRASAEALMAKRRPTMNSYDEQEQLRRAIEESKKDGLLGTEKKRGKRSREPSEEDDSPSKRPRTGSNSSFPEPEKSNALSSSDEALIDMKPDGKTRSSRIREKEVKEQKERERQERERLERQEAASKRRPRTDRRRGDESDTPADADPGPAPASTQSSPPGPRSPQPPPSRTYKKPIVAAAASNTSKLPKTRRSGARNQYTRDRDLPPSSLQHALDPNSAETRMRTRSRSRSRAPDSPSAAGGGGENGAGNNGGANGLGHANGSMTAGANGFLAGPDSIVATRPSRPKHMNPNRTSMNEMKKRVAGILEFVTKAQDEVSRQHRPRKDRDLDATSDKLENGDNGDSSSRDTPTIVNGNGSGNGSGSGTDDAEFGSLQTADMMRVLRARLINWESEYGRWGKAAS